jgi:FAD/FMN-containing dehydrogenase
MALTSNRKELSGWGRYPIQLCRVLQPRSLTALRESITGNDDLTFIARGLGRSYGDSSLNETGVVLTQSSLRRFLSFDDETGVLECESGVSIAEIIEYLLPRGWFPPVTPGTKYVTVGGAIAADVHGKNHHADGSFGNFVLNLKLLLASGEVIECSPTENAEVFWATVGGMGLTGVILSARIRLRRVESAYYDLTVKRTRDLDETLDVLAETERDHRYSVAWVDTLASGAALGRSVIMLADDARIDQLPGKYRDDPLRTKRKRTIALPLDFPRFTLNRWTVRTFNSLYYVTHRDGRVVVDHETLFYPLDSVSNWNRVYGVRGFIQYQALFPARTSRRGLIELLETIAASRQASWLAVLKSSGPANQGLLSYLDRGHTLALDLPNTGERLRRLARELDAILLRHGGRLYLAKDAMTTAEVFAAMCPQLDRFREIKHGLDPEQRFVSSQARRVGIVDSK